MEAQSTWSPPNDLYTAQSSTRVNISAHVGANEGFLDSELLASNEGSIFSQNPVKKNRARLLLRALFSRSQAQLCQHDIRAEPDSVRVCMLVM